MRRITVAALAVALIATVTLAACGKDDKAGAGGDHTNAQPTTVDPLLARQLAAARQATAPYVTDLAAATKAGYVIITPMMPEMGYHYLNPKVSGFDVTKPAILVYLRNGTGWQLGALEWVWPEQPAQPPLPGATYGSFDAACHFHDGWFQPAAAEKDCPPTNPETGAKFEFWHPKLVTMHVWIWYPNPAGLFHGTNPMLAGF